MTPTTNTWQAWVQIKWKAGAPATCWQTWENTKWVKGAWSTQGDWDCTLWVDVKTPDELEQIVWNEVRGNQWVEHTDTFWAKQLIRA